MKPIEFEEQTKVLSRPASMTDRECAFLPVHSDGKVCISCWRMTLRERLSALFYGKTWVWVHMGGKHPPIALACYRSAFRKEEKNERTDQN